MTYLGVDPAFRKNGFSIAWIVEKKMFFKTFENGFLDFILFMQLNYPSEKVFKDVVITIENSNLQQASFNVGGSAGVAARMSRNVGSNQAISQCTVDYCNANYANVYEISPKEKGAKLNNADFLMFLQANEITPDTKQTNQDKRDAGYLAVIGKNKYKTTPA